MRVAVGLTRDRQSLSRARPSGAASRPRSRSRSRPRASGPNARLAEVVRSRARRRTRPSRIARPREKSAFAPSSGGGRRKTPTLRDSRAMLGVAFFATGVCLVKLRRHAKHSNDCYDLEEEEEEATTAETPGALRPCRSCSSGSLRCFAEDESEEDAKESEETACKFCDEENVCRFCFSGPERGELISPCSCVGSQVRARAPAPRPRGSRPEGNPPFRLSPRRKKNLHTVRARPVEKNLTSSLFLSLTFIHLNLAAFAGVRPRALPASVAEDRDAHEGQQRGELPRVSRQVSPPEASAAIASEAVVLVQGERPPERVLARVVPVAHQPVHVAEQTGNGRGARWEGRDERVRAARAVEQRDGARADDGVHRGENLGGARGAAREVAGADREVAERVRERGELHRADETSRGRLIDETTDRSRDVIDRGGRGGGGRTVTVQTTTEG
eukprot:29614-Pelagococcus_subviridis.AAC.5